MEGGGDSSYNLEHWQTGNLEFEVKKYWTDTTQEFFLAQLRGFGNGTGTGS